MLKAGTKIIIASHNDGKVKEIADLLRPFHIDVDKAKNFNLDAPLESGATFGENATLKAVFVARHTNHLALSDDSGLMVEALDGAPGIYSARWARSPQGEDFAAASQKIWKKLVALKTTNWKACFVCALALASPDGRCEVFEGKIEGEIIWPARGVHGFGYDPIFQPFGYEQTFGEMRPECKHKISHRAKAFAQLIAR